MAFTGLRAQYDDTADGQRFLLNVPVQDEDSSPAITVVLTLGGRAEEVRRLQRALRAFEVEV